jgi:hypothetical protein
MEALRPKLAGLMHQPVNEVAFRERKRERDSAATGQHHQGKGNVVLFPRGTNIRRDRSVQCRERLGGLLRYYHQEAA